MCKSWKRIHSRYILSSNNHITVVEIIILFSRSYIWKSTVIITVRTAVVDYGAFFFSWELCFVCFSFLVSWEERRGRRDTRRRKEVRNYKEQELCFMRFSFLVSYERKGEEEEIPVREKRYVTIKNKSFVSCVSLFLRRMRGRRDIRPRIGT